MQKGVLLLKKEFNYQITNSNKYRVQIEI